MIEFSDGPAAGTTLKLRRAPMFLRVVIDERGDIDALDQLTDKPRSGETVYVYQMAENRGMYHLLVRGKNARSRGGWWAAALYQIHANQPGQAVLRDNSQWREWAQREAR